MNWVAQRLYFFLITLLFLTAALDAYAQEKRSGYGIYLTNEELKARTYADESKYINNRFSIDALKALIANNPKIDSIETLIPNLPISYLNNHTFFTKSQSIQGASLEYPRVVLYGNYTQYNSSSNDMAREARGYFGRYEKHDMLTIAYKSHPSLTGARGVTDDFLEVMDFYNGEFRFFEIKFKPGTPERVEVSRENPAKCMSCHLGTQNPVAANHASKPSPRPIWKFRYPDWNDGSFQLYGDDKGASNPPMGWKDFLAKNKNNPRINQLVGNLDCYRGTADCYPTPNVNIHVDSKFDWQNSQRLAKQFMQSKDYDKYKFAIYGVLKSCDKIDSFLPESVRKTHKGKVGDLTRDSKNRIERRDNIMTDKQHALTGGLRYLFEGRGLNIKHWWTSFQPKQGLPKAGDGEIEYMVSAVPEGYNSASPLTKAFEEEAYIQNDSLTEFMSPLNQIVRGYNEPVNCEKLKEKSLAAWGGGQ